MKGVGGCCGCGTELLYACVLLRALQDPDGLPPPSEFLTVANSLTSRTVMSLLLVEILVPFFGVSILG